MTCRSERRAVIGSPARARACWRQPDADGGIVCRHNSGKELRFWNSIHPAQESPSFSTRVSGTNTPERPAVPHPSPLPMPQPQRNAGGPSTRPSGRRTVKPLGSDQRIEIDSQRMKGSPRAASARSCPMETPRNHRATFRSLIDMVWFRPGWKSSPGSSLQSSLYGVEDCYFLIRNLDFFRIGGGVKFAADGQAGPGRGVGNEINHGEAAGERRRARGPGDLAEHPAGEFVPL